METNTNCLVGKTLHFVSYTAEQERCIWNFTQENKSLVHDVFYNKERCSWHISLKPIVTKERAAEIFKQLNA